MINRFLRFPNPRKLALFGAAGGLILILMMTVTFVFIRNQSEISTPQKPPIKFEYCGDAPQQLCVLSFGRDGAGNAIINFFVPDKKFPAFYLAIKNTGAENIYECKKNTEIKTSIFCSGNPLSLKQTIEINILARKDSRQLATGTFFIEAFLVSAQESKNTPSASIEVSGNGSGVSPTDQSLISPNLQIRPSQTPTTKISTEGYPNPSAYP